MPLVLSDAVAADLQLLGGLDAAVLAEFCTVCVDFMKNGVRKGVFSRVGAALGRSPEEISAAVMSLSHTFLTAWKMGASEAELLSALSDVLSLSSEAKSQLTKTFSLSGEGLSSHLRRGGGRGEEYRGAEWRLDVTLARRHAHDIAAPRLVCSVDTAAGMSVVSHTFEADYAALKATCDALDEAAAEGKTAHSRRVQRYIR